MDDALSGDDHQLSGHYEWKTDAGQSWWHRLQIQHVIQDAGNKRLKHTSHCPYDFRKNLIHQNVGDHQSNAQHYRDVEYHNKVLNSEKPKESVEGVSWEKLAASEEVTKNYEIDVFHEIEYQEIAKWRKCCIGNLRIQIGEQERPKHRHQVSDYPEERVVR